MANTHGSAHHFASRFRTRDDDLAGFGDTVNILGLVSATH
jgi:hypothetical protein